MKRMIIYILVLVVIGVGFYLGYQKVKVKQEVSSQEAIVVSNSQVLQAYKEAQAKTPFVTDPYAGMVAAVNGSTSTQEVLSLLPQYMQSIVPQLLNQMKKIDFKPTDDVKQYLGRHIVEVDMPENPVTNSIALVYYTEPPDNKQIWLDLFLYEDGIWKKCGVNTTVPEVNYDKAVSILKESGLVIKDYQLVDYSPFIKNMKSALAKANK
ncbi:MAG: hypothetical protein ACE14V_11795 [bacterium]